MSKKIECTCDSISQPLVYPRSPNRNPSTSQISNLLIREELKAHRTPPNSDRSPSENTDTPPIACSVCTKQTGTCTSGSASTPSFLEEMSQISHPLRSHSRGRRSPHSITHPTSVSPLSSESSRTLSHISRESFHLESGQPIRDTPSPSRNAAKKPPSHIGDK